jgi:adenosylhomocysteinase
MDLSFALQALAALHIAAGGVEGAGGVVLPVPPGLDRRVAQLRLASVGVAIDELTPRQSDYLNKWRV